MVLQKKSGIFASPATLKKFFEDEYATLSFVESIPCVKLKITGVPHSSEHFQLVHEKVVEFIQSELENYCRLHLLTDNTKAGIVLEEDIQFYKDVIIPEIEKAGVRFHAIVLPESAFVRMVSSQTQLSTKKLKVEYFNTVSGASKWLKNR